MSARDEKAQRSDAQHNGAQVAVIYESMFGATRRIAEAIVAGLTPAVSCVLVPISEVGTIGDEIRAVIVGAPTHGHGLSRPESRLEAARWAMHDREHLTLEPNTDDGVREWLASEPRWVRRHVAFDTRADMPRIFTGSAAAGIDRRLTKLGSDALAEPESFLVDKSSRLLAGEEERARSWASALAPHIADEVSVARR